MRIRIAFCLLLLLPCLVSAEDKQIYTDRDLERYSTGNEMRYADQTLTEVNPIDRSVYSAPATDRESADKVKPSDKGEPSETAAMCDSTKRQVKKSKEPVIGTIRGGCKILSISTWTVG